MNMTNKHINFMKNKRVTKSTVKWIATLGAILIGFIYIFWLDWKLEI